MQYRYAMYVSTYYAAHVCCACVYTLWSAHVLCTVHGECRLFCPEIDVNTRAVWVVLECEMLQNTLQRNATHCNTLHFMCRSGRPRVICYNTRCNTQKHTATHSNTRAVALVLESKMLQRTLQHTLHHTASYTLQQLTTHVRLQSSSSLTYSSKHCNKPCNTRCNTEQRTCGCGHPRVGRLRQVDITPWLPRHSRENTQSV